VARLRRQQRSLEDSRRIRRAATGGRAIAEHSAREGAALLGCLSVAARLQLDTRNNRDFGDALIRAVFDEVSVGI
jgi:hypothetical protein